MSKEFGNRVMHARKEKGLSRDELAKMIGSSGLIVGRYERGERTPSMDIDKKIPKYYGLTIDQLVNFDGSMPDEVTVEDKSLLE